jgi:hypothetical protein
MNADRHLAVLAAMASLYLAERDANRPYARGARTEVLAVLGAPAASAMLVARLRRLALGG